MTAGPNKGMLGLSEKKVLREPGTLGFLAVAASVRILILDGIQMGYKYVGVGLCQGESLFVPSTSGLTKEICRSSHDWTRTFCFNRISTSFPEISSMVTFLIK